MRVHYKIVRKWEEDCVVADKIREIVKVSYSFPKCDHSLGTAYQISNTPKKE
jgi:hypothetical protein